MLEEVGLGLLSTSALPEIRGHGIWFSVDYRILISDHIIKLQRGTTLMAFYTSHDECLTDSVSMNFSIIVSRGRRYKVAKCRSDFSASCNSQPLSSSTFPYHVILNWPESKFQWWILSWADTSKINNVVGYWLCIYCCFHLCFQVYPELARSYQVKQARQEKGKDIELEQVPAPFHGVYRHFKPAVVAALQREVLHILLLVTLLGTHRHTQTLICNLWLTNARSRFCVLPLASCVLSYDIIDSEEPQYPLREKGSGEDRWRWGQVLTHLKLHSLQFLLPRDCQKCLSGYGVFARFPDCVRICM